MFMSLRLAQGFKKFVIPTLPHDITTIYRPENVQYVPPNARCLFPAFGAAIYSTAVGWDDINQAVTTGLAGVGLLYYAFRAVGHTLQINRIDASQDFSKLYFHFNGGWFADRLFNRINPQKTPQITYDRTTGILQIPNRNVSVGSFNKNTKIDYRDMYFKLNIFNSHMTLPVGPLNLQTNQQVEHKDHLRTFCDQRHEEGIL